MKILIQIKESIKNSKRKTFNNTSTKNSQRHFDFNLGKLFYIQFFFAD